MHLSQTRTGWASASAFRGVLPWVHLSQKISPQFRQWCWKYNRFAKLKKNARWYHQQNRSIYNCSYPAVESTEICCAWCALADSFIWDLKERKEKTCIWLEKSESMNKSRIRKCANTYCMWHDKYEIKSRMQTIVLKAGSTMMPSNKHKTNNAIKLIAN